MWSHEYYFRLAVSQMLSVGAGWRIFQPSWVLANAATMKRPASTRLSPVKSSHWRMVFSERWGLYRVDVIVKSAYRQPAG